MSDIPNILSINNENALRQYIFLNFNLTIKYGTNVQDLMKMDRREMCEYFGDRVYNSNLLYNHIKFCREEKNQCIFWSLISSILSLSVLYSISFPLLSNYINYISFVCLVLLNADIFFFCLLIFIMIYDKDMKDKLGYSVLFNCHKIIVLYLIVISIFNIISSSLFYYYQDEITKIITKIIGNNISYTVGYNCAMIGILSLILICAIKYHMCGKCRRCCKFNRSTRVMDITDIKLDRI